MQRTLQSAAAWFCVMGLWLALVYQVGGFVAQHQRGLSQAIYSVRTGSPMVGP